MKRTERAIYIVLIIILVAVIASGVTYIVMDNKDDNKTNEINDKENNKGNNNQDDKEDKIALSAEEIEEYLSYVPFSYGTLIENDTYDDAYLGKNVNINNINKNIILLNAYYNTKEYTFEKEEDMPLINGFGPGFDGNTASAYYKKEDIAATLKKRFNLNISKVPTKVSILGGTLYLQNDFYLSILSAGGVEYEKYTIDYNYELINNDLIIYEESLFYTSRDLLYEKNDIFTNTNDMHMNINSVGYFEGTEYQNLDNDLQNYLENNKIQGSKYKHTFKKNDTGYYWYSTEVTK